MSSDPPGAEDRSGWDAPAGSAPPGWYPDPTEDDGSRYWDGRRWTEYTGPRESPPPGATPPGAPRADPIEPPRRLGSIAWAAYSVLGLTMLAALALVPISLSYADALQTQTEDRSLSLDEARSAADAFIVGGYVYSAASLAAIVGFLVWWYRAYSNLPSLTGHALRFGRGWSIGAWFVPVLNLWRPKQIGNDIWRGGDPRAGANPRWAALPVDRLVHWWWVFWLLTWVMAVPAGVLANIEPVLVDSVTESVSDSELESERASAIVSAASSAFEAIAAVLAIVFVKRSSERQDERIAALSPHRPDS